MKNKCLAVIGILMLTVFGMFTISAGMVSAASVPVTITYTADNVVDVWYVGNEGESFDMDPGVNGDKFKASDTMELFLSGGQTYYVLWEVRNIGSPGALNPGGFIAEISSPALAGGNLVTSSASWLVSVDGTNWSAATEYGSNDSDTIWNGANGGPISGIADDAQWIWSDDNFSGSAPDHLFVQTAIELSPVPIPGAVWLLGSGLIGLAGIRRKFKQ